jgi:hypothetical protein
MSVARLMPSCSKARWAVKCLALALAVLSGAARPAHADSITLAPCNPPH